MTDLHIIGIAALICSFAGGWAVSWLAGEVRR